MQVLLDFFSFSRSTSCFFLSFCDELYCHSIEEKKEYFTTWHQLLMVHIFYLEKREAFSNMYLFLPMK